MWRVASAAATTHANTAAGLSSALTVEVAATLAITRAVSTLAKGSSSQSSTLTIDVAAALAPQAHTAWAHERPGMAHRLCSNSHIAAALHLSSKGIKLCQVRAAAAPVECSRAAADGPAALQGAGGLLCTGNGVIEGSTGSITRCSC
jgi:hypothetical protein